MAYPIQGLSLLESQKQLVTHEHFPSGALSSLQGPVALAAMHGAEEGAAA